MSDESLPAPPAEGIDTLLTRLAPTLPRRLFRFGLAIGLIGALAAYWVHERRFEQTDDAQVDGDISSIGPKVKGTVRAVYVIDTQTVRVGDVIAEIDTTDLEIARAQAVAQLAEAEAAFKTEEPTVNIAETSNRSALAVAVSDVADAKAALAESQKEVEQLGAQLNQATAHDRQAQIELGRAEKLVVQAAVTESDYDMRKNAAAASVAGLEALRHSIAAARDRAVQRQTQIDVATSHLVELRINGPRQIRTKSATVTMRLAEVELAKAQLAQAKENLWNAKIVAPVAGIITKKGVAVGDYVAPGQQLVAISAASSLWATANFRETQLKQMRPGQPVVIHVDGLNVDFGGTVENIGGATGSRMSLLPPENASGNYVKIVQRIPVRIRFRDGQPGLDRLRIGMSIEPRVTIR